MNRYIKKSIADRAKEYVDARDINLYVQLFLESDIELQRLFDYIEEEFILPFKADFVLLCTTEHKDDVLFDTAKVVYKKEMLTAQEDGFTAFSCDGFKKGSLISSKKDAINWRNKAADYLNFNDHDEWCSDFVAKKQIEGVETTQIYHDLYDALIHSNKILTGPPDYSEISLDLYTKTFKVDSKPIMFTEFSFSVSVFSLDDCGDQCAENLKEKVIEMNDLFHGINAYIGFSTRDEWDNPPVRAYYEPYGIQQYGDIIYVLERYAEGFCWTNIFSEQVHSKIKNLDNICNSDLFDCRLLKNGSLLLCSSKSISQFKNLEIAPFYDDLKTCLRPGATVCAVKNVRKNWEDIYIPDSEYNIIDHNVHFFRGDEEHRYIERTSLVDYTEIAEKLSKLIGCECSFLSPEIYDDRKSVELYRNYIKSQNCFPMLLGLTEATVKQLLVLINKKSKVVLEDNSNEELSCKKDVGINTETIKTLLRKKPGGKANNKIASCYEKGLQGIISINMKDVPWNILQYIDIGNTGGILAKYAKSWYEKYNAVPVAISDNVIEFELTHPLSEDEALHVALEHCEICPHILQTCPLKEKSIAKYIGILTKSTIWHLKLN